MVRDYPFPTVDVPDHAHYTIGVVILAVGITGLLGNFLVIYAFCRYFFSAYVTDLNECPTVTFAYISDNRICCDLFIHSSLSMTALCLYAGAEA